MGCSWKSCLNKWQWILPPQELMGIWSRAARGTWNDLGERWMHITGACHKTRMCSKQMGYKGAELVKHKLA